MAQKKYKLTDESIEVRGPFNYEKYTLYRIEALKDFNDVKKGDKGGYVQYETNLSQDGLCWIYDESMVLNYATVLDDAEIRKNSCLCNNASVYGAAIIEESKISNFANVYEHAKLNKSSVSDSAVVCGYANVSDSVIRDYARVHGQCLLHSSVNVGDNADIYDCAKVYCDVKICGNAKIHGDVHIFDHVHIFGNADVCDDSIVKSNAKVHGNAVLCENAIVKDNAEIRGDAILKKQSDYMLFKNSWSSYRWFTWTKSNNMWSVGCFYGTGEQLIEKAYKDSENNGKHYELIVKMAEEMLKIENECSDKTETSMNPLGIGNRHIEPRYVLNKQYAENDDDKLLQELKEHWNEEI